MNFLVSNHLFIYIFLFKHSFKVCPGVLWLIRIDRSVVPAFLLTPVDLCTEIKAESHTEEKLSWYIWSETTLHSLYSRNSGHCAPSQVCLQSLGTGRWSSVQLTLTRTEKVCMSNPVCCGGLQTTCRDFHSVLTNKLSLTCCWFVSVHVPFQEYVDILLRPQATDTLGSGERTVSAVNISKLTDQWTERKLFANCFVDLFFQAYCKSLGFGLFERFELNLPVLIFSFWFSVTSHHSWVDTRLSLCCDTEKILSLPQKLCISLEATTTQSGRVCLSSMSPRRTACLTPLERTALESQVGLCFADWCRVSLQQNL